MSDTLTSARACDVVQIVQTAEGKLAASSTGVPEAALAALCGLSPRRGDRPPIEDLFTWKEIHQLRRVAMVWNVPNGENAKPVQDPISIPPPLLAATGPVPLDEDEARSLRTWGLLGRLQERRKEQSRWWCLFMPLLLIPMMLVMLMSLPFLALAWVFGLLWQTDWFAVPGGVIMRRALVWRGEAETQVFTPANTFLVIQAREEWSWGAEFWCERHILARYLRGQDQRIERRTKYLHTTCHGLREDALQLLLAAWQSPLPPPAAQDLVDFQ